MSICDCNQGRLPCTCTREIPEQFCNPVILRRALDELAAERRARNIMATLALVGWVIALAALGGAV